MITAAEARQLSNNISQLQLEQIERGIKETIIMGGTCIYYKTNRLNEDTIECLRNLGYTVQTQKINSYFCTDNTEISWEMI